MARETRRQRRAARAAAGNLMPTHRVRRADQTEWTIAAYVPGLELTTADTTVVPVAEVQAKLARPRGVQEVLPLVRVAHGASGDEVSGTRDPQAAARRTRSCR